MEVTTDIRIRAFRAIDDHPTCLKFIEGHRRVLTIYGIENITTNTDTWMFHPAVFVIVVESLDGSKMFGGARVQAADGIVPLPIEEAVGEMDSKIHDVVKRYAQNGTAELCGLWNSKEVAGLGIGSLFPTRCSAVVSEQIGITSMFSLCSPTTVRFNEWLGSELLVEVGNNGTFYYPKIDLLASACILKDIVSLEKAHARERDKAIFLRQNPQCIRVERSPFKNMYVNVHYDLIIKSANKDEFHLINKVKI